MEEPGHFSGKPIFDQFPRSDRTLKQRLKAAEDFATGKILVLVATDVAARGLVSFSVKKLSNFPFEPPRTSPVWTQWSMWICPNRTRTSGYGIALQFGTVLYIHSYCLQYIHRIGRTGRLGNIGHAISYFDPNNPKDLENAKGYVKVHP